MRGDNRKTICFVDDDRAEVARFEKVFGQEFNVIAETTYTDAVEKLTRAGRRRPHLWVLDLYFPIDGSGSSPHDRLEMLSRFDALDRAKRDFLAYIASIGQGRDGGLALLERCTQERKAPVVMFTRKGTIDDAIACHSAGADEVLKKPMPSRLPDDDSAKARALDDALMEAEEQISDRFRDLIARNTHWVKHRARYAAVATFVLGLIADRALGWIGL
jgi:CheY-like chemotaxis protein